MAITRVVVAVTGGIAAYKAAEVVSRLVKAGCAVRCIMTESAQAFLQPLTLETLSGYPVVTELFARHRAEKVEHIALAQWAEVFVIAPATANIIGKMSGGIADDFLSTCVLATEAPVLLAPAMNDKMYANPIVAQNMARLRDLGYGFVEPQVGNLACGTVGKGKMAEPADIVARVLAYGCQDLVGVRLLVTAGPTQEAIDPVRFLSNHSSGRMGYAFAARAAARGAEVTLVSGPTALQPPAGVTVVPVVSTEDMLAAVLSRFEQQDVVIKAAAPADYRPKTVAAQKIKKGEGGLTLVLERNPDILATLGARKGDKILVGFAAETNDVAANALGKLARKNLDMIIANDVTEAGSGFGVATNRVTIYTREGQTEALPLMSKEAVADAVLDRVKARLDINHRR